jgi:hypothetical protein
MNETRREWLPTPGRERGFFFVGLTIGIALGSAVDLFFAVCS